MMKAADFFTQEEKKFIEQAITQAELNTSGEIRVHVETSFSGDVLDRATKVFAILKMHKTKLRNGVLFFLGLKNRQFAIIGDAGINSVVPENFWNEIKSVMEGHFRNAEFAPGLSAGVMMAGEQLKINFPHQKDDVNELSNEVTFDGSK
jgi:uncharacterized membrane protein